MVSGSNAKRCFPFWNKPSASSKLVGSRSAPAQVNAKVRGKHTPLCLTLTESIPNPAA